MSEPVEFYTRPMTASDLPDLATLFSDAFIDDTCITGAWSGSLANPEVYPRWRAWNLHLMKVLYHRRGAYGWAVYCRRRHLDRENTASHPHTSANNDKMVAATLWIRHGNSKTAQAWQQSHSDWFSALERQLLRVEGEVLPFLGEYGPTYDRAIDNKFEHIVVASIDKWQPLINERWQLSVIAVDQAYRGRGLAKDLLEWGLKHAKDEHVPVTLFATPLGRKLYERLGFEVAEWPNMARGFHEDPEALPFMMWTHESSQRKRESDRK
ncbi:MAG: hypothetical protein Q9162_005533 [Coniocarpon cinnabarinum]